MEVSSSHQITVFLLYVLSGFICGIFFDIQRVLRKMLAADFARTTIEDFVFAAFVVFMTIAPGFFYNNGEMRYYQIIGILCGGIIYAVLLSFVIRKILFFLFSAINKFILIPALKICRIFLLPVKKIIKEIKKINNIKTKMKNKLARHIRKKKKTIKKRIKML